MAELFTLEQVKKDPQNDYILAEWHDDRPMYRLIMTDAQILQAAREEWLGVLAQLWIAYDKEIDPDRLELYLRQFGSLPLELLQEGVDRAIREQTFNSVPTIGDLWKAVRAVLGNPLDLGAAIERWKDGEWSKVNLLDGGMVEADAIREGVSVEVTS